MATDQRYPNVGFGDETTRTPTKFLKDTVHVMRKGITVDDTARDSGNSTTTKLRPGLAMGEIAATGKFKEYDPSASDGSETCVGLLQDQVNVLDGDANAVDAQGVLVFHAWVDESACHGLDAGAKADLAGQVVFD